MGLLRCEMFLLGLCSLRPAPAAAVSFNWHLQLLHIEGRKLLQSVILGIRSVHVLPSLQTSGASVVLLTCQAMAQNTACCSVADKLTYSADRTAMLSLLM